MHLEGFHRVSETEIAEIGKVFTHILKLQNTVCGAVPPYTLVFVCVLSVDIS